MGLKDRLLGRIEARPRLKWGLIGEGPEAERLRDAYSGQGADLVAQAPAERADEVLRVPGLQAVEIVTAAAAQVAIARRCLSAGLHTSLGAPLAMTLGDADDLIRIAASHQITLRVRNLFLYYEPVLKAKQLLDDRALGRLETLKLMVKYGRGSDTAGAEDRADWVLCRETGFLALAGYFFGPIAKVHARLEPGVSSVLMWKYQEHYQYGYLQLDFCPGLHVRTFTEPIARWIEITGTTGMLFIPRGEGQLLRGPALMVRGRDTTTAYEMVPDDFRQVWPNLAREMTQVVYQQRPVRSDGALSRQALALALAAGKSAARHEEVVFTEA
jgi:predicted dehydrogenase